MNEDNIKNICLAVGVIKSFKIQAYIIYWNSLRFR